ncbi:hypothetical protein, partial [Pseudomonas viridiflava]|uniref:hypothetical protein n=1 Tax=Pseudomonas viridiflava TaxID=33069 RepID=UPI001BAFC830
MPLHGAACPSRFRITSGVTDRLIEHRVDVRDSATEVERTYRCRASNHYTDDHVKMATFLTGSN